ncbi:hypothetical protein AURDEDRAFT_138975 [Auricularia subglabra TFB-10046 SS5]|nr:hypothetical protein AURDEDRAFT_138975 [Auricularia subglabra TFB-10046 SS5]
MTLFKVHAFILSRESTVFSQMFEENRLLSDDNSEIAPLEIALTKASTLGDLLQLMYLPWGTKLVPRGDTASIERRLDVMRAAKQYGCGRIVTALADVLPKDAITAPTRLTVGVTCGLRDWALDAFVEVVLGNFDVNVDDGDIPPNVLVKVWKARQLVSQVRQKDLVTLLHKHGREILCDHQDRRILRILAFTPREKFRARLFMDKEPTCSYCKTITQAWLEKIAGDPQEELSGVIGLWLKD